MVVVQVVQTDNGFPVISLFFVGSAGLPAAVIVDVVVNGGGGGGRDVGVAIVEETLPHQLLGVLPLQFIQHHRPSEKTHNIQI